MRVTKITCQGRHPGAELAAGKAAWRRFIRPAPVFFHPQSWPDVKSHLEDGLGTE